jgi:drug/metabolite transporter (DMT)-like permease
MLIFALASILHRKRRTQHMPVHQSLCLAYAIYYTSLRLFPVAKVSAAIYLSPPVTMLWAWMLFSEPLTVAMLAGLAVTLIGVWMTSRG